MKKLKSSILFILCIAVIAGLCLLTRYGITINGMNKGSAQNIVLGLDLEGGVSVTYEAVGDVPSAEDMSDTVYKLQLRANELAAESDVYQEGNNRVTVDIPGADDAKEVLETLGKPGALQFVTDYGTDNEKVWLTGADIADAQPGVVTDSNNSSKNVVSLEFTEQGSKIFAEATAQFVGKTIYIVYDGEIVSYPTVQTTITGGTAQIDGMDSYEEAEKLASVIRIGSLKVELKELTSKVVGAKLGKDAISTSLFAGLVGLLIVCVYMIFVYRIPGVAASIALILYVALDLLALNGFDMTLTLPGIAGIILSIGMAVDANVIVFARIKEELATGKSVKDSTKIGFKKAASAIVDGNVTTFIAALVLMWRGTGPVQGFAQTLAIGIVLSMFTAMVITRGILYLMYHMGCDKIGMYGVYKERKTINFLGKKTIFFIASSIAILAGLVTMALSSTGKIGDRENALNYSVEFQGGLSTTVEFDKKYSIDEFNDEILPKITEITGDSDVVGNEVTDTNEYVIRTKELDSKVMTTIKEMLVKDFGADKDSFKEVSVSSTISGEMRNDAIVAVVIAVICILIYIFIRFKDLGFASSAVIALLHDVLIVLAYYAISWTTVGNTFIACILTILGYSINATIVIFDRIRENIAIDGNRTDIKEIVNKSITQTLTRTIYTSFTTFVMVAALYVLGVTSIKEFAMPLIVGIVCGGYSSVCITGALWYLMDRRKYKKAN
ncbi:MAG: protein translocase subunit SecD [Clostridiales bacterium]|nr:protein translocase subunit SecD [Clostridiales bacterium]